MAVKLITYNGQSAESIALANLVSSLMFPSCTILIDTRRQRMFREARTWATVLHDPRKLNDGGQYVAQVLGIWEDFRFGRPAFVSLWGAHDLENFIFNMEPNAPPFTISQKLDMVCRSSQIHPSC